MGSRLLSPFQLGRCVGHGIGLGPCCILWTADKPNPYFRRAMIRTGRAGSDASGTRAKTTARIRSMAVEVLGQRPARVAQRPERVASGGKETGSTPVTSAETAGSPTCDICHRVIVHEAHGGPKPSAGDHDPAYHVAAAYGTAVPA